MKTNNLYEWSSNQLNFPKFFWFSIAKKRIKNFISRKLIWLKYKKGITLWEWGCIIAIIANITAVNGIFAFWKHKINAVLQKITLQVHEINADWVNRIKKIIFFFEFLFYFMHRGLVLPLHHSWHRLQLLQPLLTSIRSKLFDDQPV